MGKESFREVGILLGHDICLKENSRWFGLRAFDWNLILTSQGSCSVSSGQEFSCEMEFGSLTLFPPGAPRNYRIKEEWSCYWCHFVTGMVVQWPKLPGGCYQLRPSPELFEVMKQTMIEALELYRTSPRGWHLLAAHLVEGIILRGNLNVGNAEMPPEIARAQSLLDAAEFHFTDMEELALKSGLSRSVFFRKFFVSVPVDIIKMLHKFFQQMLHTPRSHIPPRTIRAAGIPQADAGHCSSLPRFHDCKE